MAVLLSFSVLAVLIGLGLYFLVSDAYNKVQEIGRITYFAGILTFLFEVGPKLVSLFD